MPSLRVNRQDQRALALDDLREIAAGADGIEFAAGTGDVVTITVKGRSWKAHLIAIDALSTDDAVALTSSGRRGAQLVVANEISGGARGVLEAADWSWLDRRVGVHLSHGSALAIIRFSSGSPLVGHGRALTTVPGHRTASPATDGVIGGRAGISYAAAVLCSPEEPPSIRRVAELAEMSSSAIGEAAKRLRDEGLIDRSSRPRVPDLFDALAAVWRPERVATVAALPDPRADGRLALNLDVLDEPGWALGGDMAAAAWGAPLFTTEAPPWLWVPSQTEARRAERSLGTASWDDRAAVVAVAPTPLVCRPRFDVGTSDSGWPTTHPVFIALDLAGDPGRGREILDEWTPHGVLRVW